MKKKVSILLSLLLVFVMVGCTSNSNKDGGNDKPTTEKAKEVPPVTIEELPLDVTVLAPDSAGYVYMDATYTNNSKYAIKSFNINVLLKDKNEKTYLGTYGTVLSGEKSPTFQSIGPDTGKIDDAEYLEYGITVIDENGKEIDVTYDAKLKTYKWY